MSSIALRPAARRSPLPYVAAIGITLMFSGYSGSDHDSDGGYGVSDGGGCGSGGAHVALGTVAMGGVGARACSRMARNSDSVVDAGRGFARSGGELGTVGARAGGGTVEQFIRSDEAWRDVVGSVGGRAVEVGEVPASITRLHPDVAGKLSDPAALRAYSEANPAFARDVSVALYLDDPAAFQRLGVDALTAGASVATPGFRAGLNRAARTRARQAVLELQKAEAAARVRIAAEHGLLLEPIAGDVVRLRVETPDYLVDLGEIVLDVGLNVAELWLDDSDADLQPISNFARFSDTEAQAAIRARGITGARPYRMHDIGPLAAYGNGGERIFVGPDLRVFQLTQDEDLQELFMALDAGIAEDPGTTPLVLRVWGERQNYQVMVPPEPGRPAFGYTPAMAPLRSPRDNGVVYAFRKRSGMGADLGRDGLFVAADGSFEPYDLSQR